VSRQALAFADGPAEYASFRQSSKIKFSNGTEKCFVCMYVFMYMCTCIYAYMYA